jgi:hypothetical protein
MVKVCLKIHNCPIIRYGGSSSFDGIMCFSYYMFLIIQFMCKLQLKNSQHIRSKMMCNYFYIYLK